MTDREQSQQLVREALARQAKADLGLPTAPTEWTYDQRIAYIRHLALMIEANAAYFEPAEVSRAIEIGQKPFSALDDTSFDWAMLVTETAKNAPGVLTTSRNWLTGILLTILGIAALVAAIKYDPRRNR